jgi:hypothetical protein
MQTYVVWEGEVAPIDRENLPPRSSYGLDWIAVEATDPDDALYQSWQFDNDTHPAITELELFASMYREGLTDL